MQDMETFDGDAYHLAVASIRRTTMGIVAWKHTVVRKLHPDIVPHCELKPGELPIASAFFSNESWWVITTRRVVSQYGGRSRRLIPDTASIQSLAISNAVGPISSQRLQRSRLQWVARPRASSSKREMHRRRRSTDAASGNACRASTTATGDRHQRPAILPSLG